MREESHLDDMRNAIRGDFERLAARRGEQELMHVSEPETPEEAPEEPPQPEPEPTEPRRSWLARMLCPKPRRCGV